MESVDLPAKAKLKREFCFQIVTARRTYLFDATSQQEKEEWMSFIKASARVRAYWERERVERKEKGKRKGRGGREGENGEGRGERGEKRVGMGRG